jgi:cell division protein FtsB
MIREIAQIKDSKPFIEEINVLSQQIKEKKQEKYQTGLGLSELKASVNVLKAEINKLKND